MNRKERKRLHEMSRTDRKFRKLVLGMLGALVWTKSNRRDRLAACEFAHSVLNRQAEFGDLRAKTKCNTVYRAARFR